MGQTAIVTDKRMLQHLTPPHHPERPLRLTKILDALGAPDVRDACLNLPAMPVNEELILRCHDKEYLKRLKTKVASGAAYIDVPDSALSPKSYESAILSAGSVIQAIDAVMAGRAVNAYCAVRPPGHHAERHRSMGFCLLANVAIGAQYLIDRYGLDRIAIFDWDVHHGNGTQQILESNPKVLFCSIHGDPDAPFYPGTGRSHEIGLGKAKGNTINIPMPLGSDDEAYKQALQRQFFPRLEKFQPQFILISAGFDGHVNDPMAAMNLSTEFFGWITDHMTDVAYRHCQGRLVSDQEGGYNVEALAECVGLHARRLVCASKALGGV